jgi:DNA-binding HxlR family transcriptional regulator
VTEIAKDGNVSIGSIPKITNKEGIGVILCSLEDGPKRFTQLMVDTKLNPNILDRHLNLLLEFGFVVKDKRSYRLTESGTKIVCGL